MTRKKTEPNRIKTSLADLLVQKNIPIPLTRDDDERLHYLEQENRRLKDQMAGVRAEIEQLQKNAESRPAESAIDTEELFQRAVAGLKSGNPIEVMGMLEAIVIIRPGHIRAMLNLAVVYAELDLRPRAMETLHAVLLLDPGNTTALRNMDILMKQANS